MNFKNSQYKRVVNLIQTTLAFEGDPGNGSFRKKSYHYVLEQSDKNIFSQIRNSVKEYFTKNQISWWGGKTNTNHSLSSQMACLNHLFPIRDDKEAVLAIVKEICPKILDVCKIETDRHMSSYIQFEAISDKDHLNEKRLTRGSNCTSLDALIVGKHEDGRTILFPIEWKYVESYGNTDKAKDGSGQTRKMRYNSLIKGSNQMKSLNLNSYYYEPFYQLMRQTLWAEQMITHNAEERIKADDFIHIHVIPTDNKQLLEKKYKVSGKNMEDSWRACLNDQTKYRLISPKALLAPVNAEKYSHLIDYLRIRYW